MGTRNLTIVYVDGEYKVAQYCQWDGYPEGQGTICLEFVRDKMDEHKFRQELKEVIFIKEDLYMKIYKMFGESDDGTILVTDSERLKAVFPELHRDTGAKILEMIQNGEVQLLHNSIDFAADGLFCEWAYVIDLDRRTFDVYTGFHKEPLTPHDRFYFLRDKEENGFSCIKLEKSWKLDELPTNEDFIKAFEKENEEL